MYYTYVLQSEVDNQFYVGYSKDLKLRFERHSSRYIESTKNRCPLKFIYFEVYPVKSFLLLFNRGLPNSARRPPERKIPQNVAR